MAKKRTIAEYFDDADSDEDLDRISEALWSDSQGKIVDKDTFDLHFKDFVGDITPRQERFLKPAVFRKLKDKHPNISSRGLFKEAGGKDLSRDRKTTAKEVTTSEAEYKRKGAQRVDLQGYDTKGGKKVYNVVGRVKGKVVYGRKTTIVLRGKKVERIRDSKGRFISTKQRK